MNTHPTTVHAAADLHRQALLTEAAADWSTAPANVRRKRTGPGTVFRRVVAEIAAVISRVIDDFEPAPVPLSRRAKHLERTRITGPLAQRNS
jgi:hypothetical protein